MDLYPDSGAEAEVASPFLTESVLPSKGKARHGPKEKVDIPCFPCSNGPVEKDRTKKNIVSLLMTYFTEASRRFPIESSFLYGSWVRGQERENSDIDVAVLFSDEAGTDTELFEMISQMTIELGHLLKKEVNIIRLSWQFEKPLLCYNATILGIPVFVRDRSRHSRYLQQALYQMEDFRLFGIGWQLSAAQNNLRELTGHA